MLRSDSQPAADRAHTGYLALALGWLGAVVEIRRQRRQLAALSDWQLRDIGLGRADVEAEITQPFWRF